MVIQKGRIKLDEQLLKLSQIEDERYFKEDKKIILFTKIIICVITYIILLLLQKWTRLFFENAQGVVAQFQVMLSIILTIYLHKSGYITAVMLNIFQAIYLIIYISVSHSITALPGIIVALTTIFTISILHRYSIDLWNKIKRIINQKQELSMLYEELIASQDELSYHNILLGQKNKILEEYTDKINKLAFHDTLTGIPKRIQVINHIEHLIHTSEYGNISFSVVMMDINDFKNINNTLGHQAGDLILQNIVKELKQIIHKEDLFGRFSGDVFALVISRFISEEELLSYITQIKVALQRVETINNKKINITASFGISIYPKDSTDCVELIKYADTTMNKAKENGKNSILFFNNKIKEEVISKIEFENQLLSAINNEELYLVFRPQYHSEDKRFRGYEALPRWNSDRYGEVSPSDFIHVAEENGFIITMGNWILQEACNIFSNHIKSTGENSIVWVNISDKQFMDPEFVGIVSNALEQSGLPPQSLVLEITENTILDELDYVCGMLNIIRGMGVRMALNGTKLSYSSLNLLQKLSIDIVKVNKNFIQDIDMDEMKSHLFNGIITLAEKMNFYVITEGIETENQLQQIKSYKSKHIIGFFEGMPQKL